ncbi:MAG: hypothetical protein WC510_03660 [Candidatus Omnitrophota bacterium]
MANKFERLVKVVYQRYKDRLIKDGSAHPDEDMLACFLERNLTETENKRVIGHLLRCNHCVEAIAVQMKIDAEGGHILPRELLDKIRSMGSIKDGTDVLKIFLRLKEKAIEIVNTTGDVLLGHKFLPEPVLRSRQVKEFKDELNIVKDLKMGRLQVKIIRKSVSACNIFIVMRDKQSQALIKNLRVSLLKEATEIESYLMGEGPVVFEHILPGFYNIEIRDIKEGVASILLEINI